MFEEFRLHPDAVKEMTVLAVIRILIILAIMPLIFLIRHLEGDPYIPGAFSEGLALWFGLIAVIAAVRIIRARQYAINFKLLCLGDQLKFTRGLTEVNLPFHSISKVVVQPDGSLMIYTGSKVPFLYISRHLERKELLLSIMSPVVRIEHSTRKHFIGDPVNRMAFYGLLMLSIVAFLTSQTAIVAVPIGIILLCYITFQIYFLTSQREYLTSPLAPVILAVMGILFLIRIIMLLGGQHFPFHIR